MPINTDAIKARLKSLEKKDKKTKDAIWRPTEGKQIIRIVPNQHNLSNPFIELKFHYNFVGKNYLSPASFGKPDPIVECAERMKRSGDKKQWFAGRNLEPKMRTFAPVVVRGEEERGVRLWGFGVTIYKQLLDMISDSEYGDITDLNEGIDIDVTFVKEPVGKQYPETTIKPKRKSSPVIDPKHPKVKELMTLVTEKQPNILEVYEPATYEELATALEEYLKKSSEGEAEEPAETNVAEPSEEQLDKAGAPTVKPVEPVVKVDVTEKESVTEEVKSPSAETAKGNVDEYTKAFANIFDDQK